MPYAIRKRATGYVVINKATGKVKSHHKTKEKALASVRATYAGLAKSGKS
jgi:hypothetical protein